MERGSGIAEPDSRRRARSRSPRRCRYLLPPPPKAGDPPAGPPPPTPVYFQTHAAGTEDGTEEAHHSWEHESLSEGHASNSDSEGIDVREMARRAREQRAQQGGNRPSVAKHLLERPEADTWVADGASPNTKPSSSRLEKAAEGAEQGEGEEEQEFDDDPCLDDSTAHEHDEEDSEASVAVSWFTDSSSELSEGLPRRVLYHSMKNGLGGDLSYAGRSSLYQSVLAEAILQAGIAESDEDREYHIPGAFIYIDSVNLDGLTTVVYDSLANWMQTAPYDVLLLQETHRGFGDEQAEWKVGQWTLITSPDPKSRFAGVAIAIRTTVAAHFTARCLPVIPGRLLHVRLSGDTYSIDLLSCYQHVISSREQRHINASKREQFWTKLGRYTSTLPQRNLLVVAGDFNCEARRTTGTAGCSAPQANSYYFDQDDFVGYAQANSLCFLNTWGSSGAQDMNTFVNGTCKSQIDYILTRRFQADSLSRRARPVAGLDFSPWRLGAKHRPVEASLPLKPGSQDQATAFGSAEQLRDQVAQALQVQTEQYTADNLNDLLVKCCGEIFPPKPKAQALRPWQQPEVRFSLGEMWRRRRELQRVGRDVRLGLFSRRQVFCAFRAYAAFQRSYREVRQRGLLHRKQLLHRRLEEARRAESAKDTRLLYQVVRDIAPKMQGGRVRIRSEAGEVLMASEEHAEISAYFQQLFSLHPHDIEPSPRLDPLILNENEILSSLGKLGKGKAVPVLHAPSSAWRHCRQQLCGPLTEAFHCETTAGYPGRWADCNLALIPKPGKTIKRPDSLRPLGIQDAAGKAIARVLKERLFVQIRETLEQYPQFAYLCNRSAQDAIQRVTEHCSKVRGKVEQDRHNIYHKKSGKVRSKYVGGAQMALDMTTAFDRLPRTALQAAMEWAKVDPNLASMILEVHGACRYRIEHEGFVSYVDMSNGVRQGCTLAPLLWALFSVYLLHRIELRLSSQWPRDSMTLYADDTHCAWKLENAQDLAFFIQSAVVVLEVYQEFGMQVNTEKSALIIRLAGTHGARWLKKHTEMINGRPHFLLAHGLQSFRVPLVQKVKYLGVIISYTNFETASVKHRLQAGGLTRQRMAKVLHSSRYLSIGQRLEIYRACVRTTILYGIQHMALSEKDRLLVHRRDVRYVRAIAKSPVHITKETTEALFSRLGLKYILGATANTTARSTQKADAQVHQSRGVALVDVLPGTQRRTEILTFRSTASKGFPSVDTAGWQWQGKPRLLRRQQRDLLCSSLRGLILKNQLKRRNEVKSECRTVALVRSSPCSACGRSPLQEMTDCFQHMQGMEVDATLGKREAPVATDNQVEQAEPQQKHSRPQSKGLGGQGKGGRGSGPDAAPVSPGTSTGQGAPEQPVDPLVAAAAAFGDRGQQQTTAMEPKQQGNQTRQQGRQQQGWKHNQGQRRGWSSYNWGGQRKQKEEQAWEDNLRLLARLCLRHEDELSQTRVERDFILTMETQEAAVLTKLYKLATVWKERKERQEVDCSLRLCLFLGLLQVWLERMRALEQNGPEAEALRKRIMEQGYAQMPEGTTELQWFYMRWNHSTQAMEKVPDVEPMLQSQVVSSLVQLQATMVAPNALLRFHSTRRMAAEYAGETVTFLLTIGQRDTMAAQAWGMLTNLCGNGSGKAIGLKMKPARMDRQPLAKIVAERFPPPMMSSRAAGSQQRETAVDDSHQQEKEECN
ncbi:unnamed protein product [Symbiodinium sp. CCMP2592]|nr:unnamed protein product [Symbiodinium sp. CCMP2592]